MADPAVVPKAGAVHVDYGGKERFGAMNPQPTVTVFVDRGVGMAR